MDIYHEEHGTGEGCPLVLIHGALSGIGTSFGAILPLLSKTRRVIAVELQAHGRTPDIDRPLTVEHFAADVVELLDRLGIERADVFGWSMGAQVALRLGTDHADRVRRLVLASVAFDIAGMHPGLLDGIQDLQPEHLHGSEFREEYLRTAPDPAGWPEPDHQDQGAGREPAPVDARADPVTRGTRPCSCWPTRTSSSRACGGMSGCSAEAVPGDLTGLPACRLAILPGTTHTTIPQRADWLAPMIDEFLDKDDDGVRGGDQGAVGGEALPRRARRPLSTGSDPARSIPRAISPRTPATTRVATSNGGPIRQGRGGTGRTATATGRWPPVGPAPGTARWDRAGCPPVRTGAREVLDAGHAADH